MNVRFAFWPDTLSSMTDSKWQPRTVLVVDDHPGARRWLAAAVASAFPEARCLQAANLAEARERLPEHPDLALLDLKLPDGVALDLMPALLALSPPALCVIATLYDDDDSLYAAMQRGAGGYVLKEQSREQLATLLRAMTDGQPPLSPAIARRLMRQFAVPVPASVKPAPETPPPDLPSLTPRERETLGLIGRGYSVTETAGALGLSGHTVHDYVRSIYRKLSIASRAEAALMAREMGL